MCRRILHPLQNSLAMAVFSTSHGIVDAYLILPFILSPNLLWMCLPLKVPHLCLDTFSNVINGICHPLIPHGTTYTWPSRSLLCNGPIYGAPASSSAFLDNLANYHTLEWGPWEWQGPATRSLWMLTAQCIQVKWLENGMYCKCLRCRETWWNWHMIEGDLGKSHV